MHTLTKLICANIVAIPSITIGNKGKVMEVTHRKRCGVVKMMKAETVQAQVDFVSRESEGTTFRLRLPKKPPVAV